MDIIVEGQRVFTLGAVARLIGKEKQAAQKQRKREKQNNGNTVKALPTARR